MKRVRISIREEVYIVVGRKSYPLHYLSLKQWLILCFLKLRNACIDHCANIKDKSPIDVSNDVIHLLRVSNVLFSQILLVVPNHFDDVKPWDLR